MASWTQSDSIFKAHFTGIWQLQNLLTYHRAEILNWGWFWPPGVNGNVWRHFLLSQLGVYGEMCASDIWVEARDAKILQQNNYMARNVNCAEAEEPYLRRKVLLLLSARKTKTESMPLPQHICLIVP